MQRRRITKSQTGNSRVRRENAPISLKYILLSAFCGLILVVGFFGAARQHFASINYGIENSKLKKQVEELKSEQRRLQLSREVSLSPAEIKKSAKKMGFTEMSASNIQSFKVENNSEENSNNNKSNENKSDEKLNEKSKDKPSEPKVPKVSPAKTEKTEKVQIAKDDKKKKENKDKN